MSLSMLFNTSMKSNVALMAKAKVLLKMAKTNPAIYYVVTHVNWRYCANVFDVVHVNASLRLLLFDPNFSFQLNTRITASLLLLLRIINWLYTCTATETFTAHRVSFITRRLR